VYPNDEIESLPKGFEVQRVVRLNVPGLEAERHLVFIGAV
jgi:16S rRNA (guanine527-N7)-methyltransferase